MFIKLLHTLSAHRFIPVLLIFLGFITSINSFASEDDIRRRVAFKLFRATLAADMKLTTKISSDNTLHLILVYKENKVSSKLQIKDFIKRYPLDNLYKSIKRIPVSIAFISTSELLHPRFNRWEKLAGIYLLDELPEKFLQNISRSAIASQIISYSPFKGDVEAGILGGLYVGNKVQPYINIKVMKQSNIHLKPFFMKVIKRYEP